MGQNVEIYLLRNLQLFRIFLVQFLIIGLFTNSLLSQACLCAEACRHGLQDTAKARQWIPFHTRCSGTQCTSCNVEDVQTIKLSSTSRPTAKLTIQHVSPFPSNFPDCESNVDFSKIFFSYPNRCIKVQSKPNYLQNLSLLLWIFSNRTLPVIKSEQSFFGYQLFSCSESGTNNWRNTR